MMLELKSFVQESVQALDDGQLHLLSETLRIDLRGCEDRSDIERILTGLLCLDQDTALGTFLVWLRAREATTQRTSLIAKKNGFVNTFVPLISPRHGSAQSPTSPPRQSPNKPTTHEPNQIKDHHLNEEITQRLQELKLLELDFKEAERHVHSGTPSFEKLKAFLVKLTRLRTKEDDVRRYFIRQSEILTEQHAQMKAETLHTREQLDFFVDGFTNLRHRHDALLESATQMKAENEAAQEIFLAMSVNESHFAGILHRTLLQQLDQKQQLQTQLEEAGQQIRDLKTKQAELERCISQLKQQRGDAMKDANCYKLQLRKCKQAMRDMATEGPDCAFFRQQAIQMREALTTLLTVFKDSIARDTKSAKQTVSREVLRTVQTVLTPPRPSSPLEKMRIKPIRVAGAAEVDRIKSIARVVEKKTEAAMDLDEAVRGVVLLGGDPDEAETCATRLSTKLRYVAIDLKKILTDLHDEYEREAQERLRQAAATLTMTTDLASVVAPPIEPAQSDPSPTLSIENYRDPVESRLRELLRTHNARGMVLYNWELSALDVNLLIAMGFPIDSIIELKPSPPPPPPKPTMLVSAIPSSPTDSSSKPTTQKTPGSATRSTATPSKSPSKATSTTPATSPSRQVTTKQAARSSDTKKTPTTPATPSKPSGNNGTMAVAALLSKIATPKIDRKAVFRGMPHVFTQLEPVQFVDERIDRILEVLTKRRDQKAAPFVEWDEDTRQINEALMMWTEDVHMMLWVEQESRRPKKPGETPATTPSSPSKPTTNSTSSSASSSATSSRTSSRAGAKPASSSGTKAGAKVTSSSRSSSPGRASSPAKPTKPTSSASPKRAPTASTGSRTSASATSPKRPESKASSPVVKTPSSASKKPSATPPSPNRKA